MLKPCAYRRKSCSSFGRVSNQKIKMSKSVHKSLPPFLVARETCRADLRQVHFPFLNKGNRKASGLRLKRNTAHRFVIILIFDQGSFSIVGQSTEGSRRWFLFHLTVALVLAGQKLRRGITELSILGSGLLGPLKFKTRISFSVCTTSAVIKCWSSILACVCQKLELLPFFFF